MKITDAHYSRLLGLVHALDTPAVRAAYRAGEFRQSSLVKDLDKRYRWDLFQAAMRGNGEFVDDLYSYLSDAHLDTALRRAVPPLPSRA